MKRKIIYILAIVSVMFSACSEDYLETGPTNEISDQAVFETAEGAQTVLDGVKRDLREFHSNHDQFGVKAIDLAQDLMGEDIAVERFHWFGYDYNIDNRNATYRRPTYTWTLYYRAIYNVNGVINNIDEAASDSEEFKQNLKAQALTIRAFSYFRLVQMFQFTYKGHENDPGVPIYLEGTVEGKERSSVSQVYDQIVADLDEAISLFQSSGLAQRHISDPTLNIAQGVRARVALVMNDWNTAATMASAARNGYSIMSPDDFSTGFDSYAEQNWMWGLEINDEQSTIYASWFSHMDWTIGGYCGLGYSPKSYSLALYNEMDDNDVRKQLIDATDAESGRLIPYKFASGGDKEFAADYVMMRPEEMLLIEAEARARKGGEDSQAQALLKELRDHRYSVEATVSETGQALLDEILLERRIELWGEGFRGLDIKRLKIPVDRTNSNHDPVVAVTMQLPAESNKLVYQIPQDEIDANDLISENDQNP
ncbi:RagB/SusD family nutrient uptake outer membrane protein [Maribellus mangrovi]|uniref:RagB/SusD family nutrient uptake outer membrane protein n=1 Tax=Maribellus mangrovi TaxID=3133146 RepID=UPI0030EDB968